MRIKTPPVSHECIDGEVVVINMESGIYYSLLDLGARIWELVGAGLRREEVLQRVAAAYPDEARAAHDASAILDQWIAEGLVVEEPGTRNEVSIELPAEYSVPRLERFTDLQEMLMLDPIHEVDAAAGWPHKAD